VKSLAEWLDFLERLHPSAIDMGLERVAAVASRLAITLDMPILTVGGTNGKGSVCAYLEAILRHAGFRTGLYTSPHLLRYNERVRVDGEEVDDAAIVQAFERIEQVRGDTSLTYFEFGTLAAALTFQTARVDALILEVGLGGRLDAVNIFAADCAVIVSIDLDHMAFLGNDREAIGREKAGIMRPGRPVICADPDPPTSLIAHARTIGAHLRLIGADFGYAADRLQWNFWGPAGKRSALAPPALRGEHQYANAAAAIAALDELKSRLPVGMYAIRMGLATASLPGRYQVLPGRPSVVLDVAHNPHAARALAANLDAHRGFGRTYAVFAMLADKDIGAVVDAVKSEVDGWYVASLSIARGTSSDALATIVASHDPAKYVRVFDSPVEAYRDAYKSAGQNDRILVFGSFHTVAEVLASHAHAAGGGDALLDRRDSTGRSQVHGSAADGKSGDG
jgi:dihydrofolate synthase/folylpolyglutamate synthase